MIHFILDPTNASLIEALSGVAEAVFALALIFVGIAQVYVYFMQAGIMRGQLEVAKIAADASKEASDSLRLTERAFLALAEIKVTGTVVHGGRNPGAFGGAELTWGNYGKTPANVRELQFFFRALDHEPSGQDEVPPDGAIGEYQPCPIIVIGANDTWTCPNHFCWDQAYFNEAKFGKSDKALYAWGHITYRTVFSRDETTTFKLRFDHQRGWLPIGQPHENEGK